MTRGLTHLDDAGAARMVDVGAKQPSSRHATAQGEIAMTARAIAAIRDGSAKKGDVLAVARVAGIMAAKRVPELIPLCHSIALTSASIDFALGEDRVTVTARVSCTGPTGVEMEALTAASVALLTLYDMLKSVDRAMVIDGVRLIEKHGGKSGDRIAP